MKTSCVGLLFLMLLQIGCSSDRAMRRESLVEENLKYAARHQKKGETEEAAQLYMAVLLADPTNAKAQAGLDAIPEHDSFILGPSILGVNRDRYPLRKSPALWIALYPINRILDVLDIVSFRVGLEGGVYANAHVTHAIAFAAGAGGGWDIGLWQKCEFGLCVDHVAGVALGPFSAETEADDRIGTRGLRNLTASMAGFNRPSDPAYQTSRDYWGIGARAIAGIAGAEVEVHPVEIADAIAGFFFIDFLRDDLGRTRGLKLRGPELEAMGELINTLSSSEFRAGLRGRKIVPVKEKEEAEPAPESAAPATESSAPPVKSNDNLEAKPAPQPAAPAPEPPAPAPSAPAPESAAPAAKQPLTHTVVPGETLAAISRKYYGTSDKWELIAEANKDLDPVMPKAGAVIVIPDPEDVKAAEGK